TFAPVRSAIGSIDDQCGPDAPPSKENRMNCGGFSPGLSLCIHAGWAPVAAGRVGVEAAGVAWPTGVIGPGFVVVVVGPAWVVLPCPEPCPITITTTTTSTNATAVVSQPHLCLSPIPVQTTQA